MVGRKRKQIVVARVYKLTSRHSRYDSLRNTVINRQLVVLLLLLVQHNLLVLLFRSIVVLWKERSCVFLRGDRSVWYFACFEMTDQLHTRLVAMVHLVSLLDNHSNIFFTFFDSSPWFVLNLYMHLWFWVFIFVSFLLFLGLSLDLWEFGLAAAIEGLMVEVALWVAFTDLVERIHVELDVRSVTCLTKEE